MRRYQKLHVTFGSSVQLSGNDQGEKVLGILKFVAICFLTKLTIPKKD